MRSRQRVAHGGFVAATAMLAMGGSLGNRFAYDDTSIIALNGRVHSLTHWWQLFGQSYWPPPSLASLYRPLPMLAYAVQWVLAHGQPWLFHLTNVGVYAMLALAVWTLAVRLLGDTVGLGVGALFAAHPVHVEAVANSIGLAELGMALGLVLATMAYLRAREDGMTPSAVARIVSATALAAFCKEQGVLVPAVLVVAELVIVRDARPVAARLRALAPVALSLASLLAVYFVLRGRAVETWGDAPAGVWMVVTDATRRWTMLGIVSEWARLLFWPVHLAIEYSPPDIPVYRGWSPALLPGAAIVVATLAGIAASWRRAPVAAFGLLLVGIGVAPVSNLGFPTGVMLAERTLLVPSIGLLLALGAWGAAWYAARPSASGARVLGAAVAVLVVAGGMRSALRVGVWKDDETLFHQSVVETPESYRSHYQLGTLYLRTGRPEPGERELRRSIELFPDDYGSLQVLAEAYRKKDLCPPAMPLYERALEVYPAGAEARAGLVSCLIGMRRWDDARANAEEGVKHGAETAAFRQLIVLVDSLRRTVAAP